jgi:hypothetical protein
LRVGQAKANLPHKAARAALDPGNCDDPPAHNAGDGHVHQRPRLLAAADHFRLAALGAADLVRLRLNVQPQAALVRLKLRAPVARDPKDWLQPLLEHGFSWLEPAMKLQSEPHVPLPLKPARAKIGRTELALLGRATRRRVRIVAWDNLAALTPLRGGAQRSTTMAR